MSWNIVSEQNFKVGAYREFLKKIIENKIIDFYLSPKLTNDIFENCHILNLFIKIISKFDVEISNSINRIYLYKNRFENNKCLFEMFLFVRPFLIPGSAAILNDLEFLENHNVAFTTAVYNIGSKPLKFV